MLFSSCWLQLAYFFCIEHLQAPCIFDIVPNTIVFFLGFLVDHLKSIQFIQANFSDIFKFQASDSLDRLQTGLEHKQQHPKELIFY